MMTQTTQAALPEVLVIGEVLFDIFPDYRRLGGAPFNFAVHMHKMGFATAFVSRIGMDQNGDEIKSYMDRIHLPIQFLQLDSSLPTGYVSVTFDDQMAHQFDIAQNVAYDYLKYTNEIEHLLNNPIKLIYFGTLIQRTRKGFETVQRILNHRHPTTQTFYDLNFRPDCYDLNTVVASLKQTDILKLNHEELEKVGEFFNIQKDTKSIVAYLMNEYQIKTVVVTRGADGSEWFNAHLHSQTNSPELQVMADTVGAGDAFAAAAAAGHLRHWPIDQALNAASQFATRICGVEGALPTDDRLYDELKDLLGKKE